MSGAAQQSGALSGLRVVELASEQGAFAGKLLGDLGAEVILVEPKGGHPTRRFGPFPKHDPDAAAGLWWWHFNTSKLGVELDLNVDDDRRRLAALISDADLVLEAEPPGRLRDVGLDYGSFGENERLVWISVAPFGSDHPRAHEPATDLTLMAGAGPVWSCGYDDHALPPVRCEGDQGYQTASIFAVMAGLTAFLSRMRTGLGQYVDVSSYAASNVTTETATVYWLVAQQTVTRQTGRHAAITQTTEAYAYAADGRLVHTGTLPRVAREYSALIEWLDALGLRDDFPDAIFLEMAVERGEIPLSEIGHDPVITEICRAARDAFHLIASRVTGHDFFIGAQSRGLQAGVVNTVADLVDDPQYAARGFLVERDEPELGGAVVYPGAPFRMSKTPWRLAGRAPHLGEHNEVVLAKSRPLDTSTAERSST